MRSQGTGFGKVLQESTAIVIRGLLGLVAHSLWPKPDHPSSSALLPSGPGTTTSGANQLVVANCDREEANASQMRIALQAEAEIFVLAKAVFELTHVNESDTLNV